MQNIFGHMLYHSNGVNTNHPYDMKVNTKLNILAFLFFIILAPFTYYQIRCYGIPATRSIIFALQDPQHGVQIRHAFGPILSVLLVSTIFGGIFTLLRERILFNGFFFAALGGILLGILGFDLGVGLAIAIRFIKGDIFLNHEIPNASLLIGSFIGFIGGFAGGVFKKDRN